MSVHDLSPGVKLTRRRLPGGRVIVKNGRLYGNIRQVSAKWPEAGMHEVEHPRALWVAEGQVNCQIGHYVLGCKTGDFVLMPPQTPHPADKHPNRVTSNIPGHTCVLLWMSLYHKGFHCWLSGYDDDGKRHDSAAANYLFLNGQVIQLLRLFIDEASGERDERLCNGLLVALGAAIQREVKIKRYLLPGVIVNPGVFPPITTDFVQRLENYIQQHLDQSLTLEQAARSMYMSRTQFIRMVRKETGKSFVEVLTEYRIKEAQILLTKSEWTVQVIAQFLGFKSSTYFHELFRQRVGCTPGEFRRRNASL